MKLVISYQQLLDLEKSLIVSQKKEWMEILIDWEAKNYYNLLNSNGGHLAVIVERGGNWSTKLKRWILRSHRSLEIDVMNTEKSPLLFFSRNFFFLFSELNVMDDRGQYIGCVRRRFGLLYKKYDLVERDGNIFGRISSPLWQLWRFSVFNNRHQKIGEINKKWQGLLKEAFSDADSFSIDFGDWSWESSQKAIILAAAISIDFDFFENNQGNQGGFF